MYEFTIKGQEKVDELLARFRHPELGRRMRVSARLSSAKILAEAVAFTQEGKDTGMLAQSLDADVFEEGPEIVGKVFSPLAYAIVREFGRRPGKAPPPPGALLGWIKRHEAPQEVVERYPTIEARERALAWSIAAKGSPPMPFLLPAWRANIRYTLETLMRVMFEDEGSLPRE